MIKNKKGAQDASGISIGTIIALIVMFLVVILVIILWLKVDLRGAVASIFPGFLTGDKPVNMTVNAKVYNTNVQVLVNDGKGRCIIADIYDTLPGSSEKMNPFLVLYGLRENKLIRRPDEKSDQWAPEETGMVRFTNYMKEKREISVDLKSAERNILALASRDMGMYKLYTYDITMSEEQRINSLSLATIDPQGNAEKQKAFDGIFGPGGILEDLSGYKVQLVRKDYEGGSLYFFQSTEEGYKSFYVRGYQIYQEKDGKLLLLDPKTNPLYSLSDEDVKEQIIKQDLYLVCAANEKDIVKEELAIDGTSYPVTLLKKDEFKRCLIHESTKYPLLEHYALQKPPLGFVGSPQLYMLDTNGLVWNNIEKSIPAEEEIVQIRLARRLIQHEKDFGKFIGEFEVKIEPDSQQANGYIELLKEGKISYYHNIIMDITKSQISFLRKDTSGETKTYTLSGVFALYQSSFDTDLKINLDRDNSYLFYPSSTLAVQNGEVYVVKDGKLVATSYYDKYLGFSEEELNSLDTARIVKQQLIEKC